MSMTCVVCNHKIKADQLFVSVVLAADDEGTEAPLDDRGRLAMHAGACPPLSAAEAIE